MWRPTERAPYWTIPADAADGALRVAADGASPAHPRLLLFFALEGRGAATARRRYEAVLALYRRVGPPTPADARAIREGAPCIVPLEDAEGRCARSRDGRLVIVQLGVCLGGDAASWIRQFCLAQDRLAPSVADGEVPAPLVVLDAAVPSTLWIRPLYLRFLVAQPTHARVLVCGLTPRARAFAEWVLAPLPTYLTAKVALHAGYDALSAELERADLPTRWGGTNVHFDLDAYGARVARELGPTHMPWWDPDGANTHQAPSRAQQAWDGP
jgi:hypothetical protein